MFAAGLKSTSWENEVETPCNSTVENYGRACVHAFACVVQRLSFAQNVQFWCSLVKSAS